MRAIQLDRNEGSRNEHGRGKIPHQPLDSHIYRDISATNAVRRGGAGILIEHPNRPREGISKHTEEFCSNYKAEITVIEEAAHHISTEAPG